MSSGQASRQRKEPAAQPRAPLFEVQEKPLRKPPRPIETVLGDVGDLPDGSRRAPRRAPPELRTVEPDLAPEAVRAQPAPRAAAAPAYTEARPGFAPRAEFARPERARLPAYQAYPHWDGPRVPAGGRMLLLLAVAIVCGVVAWMYFQSPKTYISRYGAPGWSEVAGDDASRAVGAVDVAPGEHSVVGEPSVTADDIDIVLAQYNSPAQGTGKIWIELGRKYGIDPAYALAFFIHESSAGTNPQWDGLKPDGSTTHNIGNISCAGYPRCLGRWRDYSSWDEGIEDWYRVIRDEYVQGRGIQTVEQIMPLYAPAFENDVDAYVQTVVTLVDGWRQHGVAR